MTDFSGVRAVIIVTIIFIGAFGLLFLKSASTAPVGQRQQYLRRFIIFGVVIVLLVLLLIFLPTIATLFFGGLT